MCVNNLPKVATQWNSGATRDSNPGPRARIPSALTTKPLSHTAVQLILFFFAVRANRCNKIKTSPLVYSCTSFRCVDRRWTESTATVSSVFFLIFVSSHMCECSLRTQCSQLCLITQKIRLYQRPATAPIIRGTDLNPRSLHGRDLSIYSESDLFSTFFMLAFDSITEGSRMKQ